MANTSSFSYSNVTAGTSVATTKMGPTTNYAKVMDEPTEARFTNKTASLDQGELVTYRSREIANVSTYQAVVNPPRFTPAGVEYGVRVDEILRTVNAEGDIVCDEPIVASLTIKHPKSSNVTSAIVTQVVTRLLGSVYDETAKAYRWDDLMRSALVPTED